MHPCGSCAWDVLVDWNWLTRLFRRRALKRERQKRSEARARWRERRLVRTEHALSLNLVERRLGAAQDLARALREVINLAYELTEASSCEIALYTLKTGAYQSALLVGWPTDPSAQAMLGEAAGENPLRPAGNTVVQPIIFAGETLGSLRLSFEADREVSTEERDVAKLLAVQAGVAILNSRHSRELSRISKAADESFQAKMGFLANLSHEIRAPLGIMVNGVELVLRGLCGEVNEDMNEVLGMVKTSGSHLLELVNDVLDYAKANAGLLEAQVEFVDLGELLTDVQKIIRPMAEKKGHLLDFVVPKEPVPIEVDRRQVRQIALNLLTNAVKYTKDGGAIVVTVEVSDGRVVVSVRDNGIGMKHEDLAHLFDPFKRSADSYARSQEGTGLGMALAKQLVELNGGTIAVRSSFGEGTDVLIEFPLSEREGAESLEGEDIVIDGAGRRVMVVELTEAASDTLARYLENRGFRVSHQRVDSREELATITVRGVAVVVLCAAQSIAGADVAVVREILDREESFSALRSVLVVIGTQASKEELEPLLQTGVDRYIAHPAPLEEIARAIDEVHRSATGTVIDRNPPSHADIVQ